MTYGSVCSGIEAASVAWQPLGWRAAFVSEIEPFPKAVLAHRWPDVPDLGDFTQIGADRGPIDLLVGGTPCQSFSIAGLRGGLSDSRGNLALEFCRLAARLQPRWVVWENVPGVLSSGGGRDFGSILGALAELGYGWAYRVLDAQYFGVAQRRRRVFVVAHTGGLADRAGAVLLEPEGVRGDPPPRRAPGSEVTGTLGGGSGNRGWCDDLDRAGAFVPVAAYGGGNTSGPLGVATTRTAHPTRHDDAAVRRLTPRECERLQGFPDDYTLVPWRRGLAADGPRYRAIGNSMAAPVMRWIGRRIDLVDLGVLP